MNSSARTTPSRFAQAAIGLAVITALAACGGGGDSNEAANASKETAQSASADTGVAPSDASEATAAAFETTQAVVTLGNASATVACAGGGSAVFQASGASLALLANHQFDAGEHYSVTFTDCKNASGRASVNGSWTLDVVSASGSDFQVATATNNIVVALPLRTVTLNGSSSLTHSVVVNGTTTTTTNHWVTPSFTLQRVYANRSATYTLSNVDLTRTFVVTNGVLTGSSSSGTSTLSVALPRATFTVTLATQGAVTYDANGMPMLGAWTLTLPNNAITVSVTPGTVTIGVDYGANGTIDATYTLTIGEFLAASN